MMLTIHDKSKNLKSKSLKYTNIRQNKKSFSYYPILQLQLYDIAKHP